MLYLLIVNATILITYSLYVILFRKLTFFQWNRVYLLSMLVVSLLIPVGLYIDLSQYQVISQQLPTIDLSYMAEISVLSVNDTVQPVRLMDVLIPIYWIGFGISLLWFCYRLYMLFYRSKAIGTRESFSFLGRMVLGEKVAHNKTIEAHESVHIQQGHTYDILFLEIVRCFNWFNPVLYFYRKELKFQHECIADEYCANNKVAYAEMLVAHALDIDDFKLSHGFSNHSFLKKRIMMLFKNKSKTKHKYFYLFVIPAMLILTMSTLVFNTSKARGIMEEVDFRIQNAVFPSSITVETNSERESIALDAMAKEIMPESAPPVLSIDTDSKDLNKFAVTEPILTSEENTPDTVSLAGRIAPNTTRFDIICAEPVVTWDQYISVLNKDLNKVGYLVYENKKILVEIQLDENGNVLETSMMSMVNDKFLNALKSSIEKNKWKPMTINGERQSSLVKIEFDTKKSGELSPEFDLMYL